MSDLNPSSILLTTETDRLTVNPGEKLEIPVIIKNRSASPDQVRITVEGVSISWISTDLPIVVIQPEEERRIILVVQPPAPPKANAGRHLLRIVAISTFEVERKAEALVSLTVAGFEVPGRVGVLLNGLQYGVTPGEKLAVPVVLINQGLGPDTFRVETEGLPLDWLSFDPSEWYLKAGEVANAVLIIQPPRNSTARAGRWPFNIMVKSEYESEQNVLINCVLTVGAYTEITTRLFAPNPEREQPARVQLINHSNTPVSARVSWESPDETLAFEPSEPQQVSLALDASVNMNYEAKPIRRYWVGGEKIHPYTVTVKAPGIDGQTLRGAVNQKAVMPPWLAVIGIAFMLLCCLLVAGIFLVPNVFFGRATPTVTLTATMVVTNTPMPTATQSQIDQRPLLVDRSWFLVSYNESLSKPGSREPFTRFNQDGSLIGFTGCKDFNGAYQTEYNRITIPSINLNNGACPDPLLQVQEDMFLAILRSARSFLVADTTLQLSGDSGFLNYSLTPPVRPQEIPPPQAVIQSPPQALVGEIMTFDGSQSTGTAPLVSWKWEFGDGHRSSGKIVQHAIGGPGAFAVQLTVSDQRGQTHTTSRQVLILPQPTAVPTAAPPPTATPVPPVPTEPHAATNVPPVAPTPTEVPPPTEPPLPEIVPPQANLIAPRSGYIGEPVDLDASGSSEGSSPIVSFTWVFGNGTVQPSSPDPRITTIYNSTGMYEISVIVEDGNGQTNSAVETITINARLDTSAWTLSTINGQPLRPGTAITLQFLNGEFTGFAGCNDYSGRYTVVDNGDGTFSVAVDRFRTGRRSCPAEIMDQELAFESAIQLINSAVIQENMLTLSGPDVKLVFFLISGP